MLGFNIYLSDIEMLGGRTIMSNEPIFMHPGKLSKASIFLGKESADVIVKKDVRGRYRIVYFSSIPGKFDIGAQHFIDYFDELRRSPLNQQFNYLYLSRILFQFANGTMALILIVGLILFTITH